MYIMREARQGASEAEATIHHDASERPVDVVGVEVILYAVNAIWCQFPKNAHAVSHPGETPNHPTSRRSKYICRRLMAFN
jgi:hypothetical protein